MLFEISISNWIYIIIIIKLHTKIYNNRRLDLEERKEVDPKRKERRGKKQVDTEKRNFSKMNKQEIIKHSQKTLLYHRIREGIHTVVSQQLTRDMTSFPIKNAFSIPMLAQKVIMNDETFPRLGGVHPVGSISPMNQIRMPNKRLSFLGSKCLFL
jgi:hypothetical protein